MNEQSYEQGRRMALRQMLQACLRELGVDDPEAARARWLMEREEAVSTLRDICERHGDNDWPINLNLADVIEKHLGRHLGQ